MAPRRRPQDQTPPQHPPLSHDSPRDHPRNGHLGCLLTRRLTPGSAAMRFIPGHRAHQDNPDHCPPPSGRPGTTQAQMRRRVPGPSEGHHRPARSDIEVPALVGFPLTTRQSAMASDNERRRGSRSHRGSPLHPTRERRIRLSAVGPGLYHVRRRLRSSSGSAAGSGRRSSHMRPATAPMWMQTPSPIR